ncbi:hypothetical protein BC332_05625 [Capsicum chinense]|nr:hypothetical protein BC332_05625 [Capsicum chinense]
MIKVSFFPTNLLCPRQRAEPFPSAPSSSAMVSSSPSWRAVVMPRSASLLPPNAGTFFLEAYHLQNPDANGHVVSKFVTCVVSGLSDSWALEKLQYIHLHASQLSEFGAGAYIARQVLDYIEDIGLEEIAYSPFLAPYSHRVFHYIGFQTKKIEILCVSFTGNSDLGCDYVLSGCESIYTRQESCPVEKLYIYRTAAGWRFDMPDSVWNIDRDAAASTSHRTGNCPMASA